MSTFNAITSKIGSLLNTGRSEFVIYPFGRCGAMVKGILNGLFNICELAVADNFLCTRFENIKEVKDLPEIMMRHPQAIVLVSHENVDGYEEVRNRLYEFVDQSRCIEMYPTPAHIYTDKHQVMALEKKQRIGFDDALAIYKPLCANATFYMPLWQVDDIQNRIFLSDDYYSREQLSNVFESFREGIIGRNSAGKLFLDIGANIGNHTLFFARELKAGCIHSFEPVTQTFRILQSNVEINNLMDKVCLHNLGLGKEACKASTCGYDKHNIGGVGLKPDESGSIEVRRLDDFTFEDKIFFIKIDTEGAELSILQGGEQTIKKHKPYILLEAWYESIEPIRAFLHEFGYVDTAVTFSDYLFYPA